MIEAEEAIARARALLGTPYSELDCINLIKKVIRTSAGGVKNYTTAGTNALWDSYDMSAKYKDLTWRQTGIEGAKAGMIPFKASGDDYHHAGIATGEGTVIHSSSTKGGRGVVETPLTAAEGWTHLAVHRYIEAADGAAEEEKDMSYLYTAQVKLADAESKLNVRKAPSGDVIGKIGHGAIVQVYAEKGEWAFVRYGDSGSGYVSVKYLAPYTEPEKPAQKTTALIREDGASLELVGVWRLAGD